MLAALAKKYKKSPLDDATLDTMCTVPEEQWPPELAGKVEALLKAEPKPAGGKWKPKLRHNGMCTIPA